MSGDDVIWLRPETAATGRPAERSRAEITAAAVAVADRDGLDAVSMRKVAAELGTGAASLYRYVGNRDDLLELMVDSVAAEVELTPSSGDTLADLVAFGVRQRALMRRHAWLPTLMLTRTNLGPSAAGLLEYVLTLLADHPQPASAKLETFALVNGFAAMYAHNENSTSSDAMARQVEYLRFVAADGGHPRLAGALAAAGPPVEGDRFPQLLRRVLNGLLTD